MEALAAQVIEHLRDGESAVEALARAGDADPAAAARAFAEAAADPDLGPACEHWVPALLRTAQPGFGATRLRELAERSRTDLGRPLEPDRVPALPRVLGSSRFLARLLSSRPEWIAELEGALPAAPEAGQDDLDWVGIRRAKYRGLLRIAGRDLCGRPFDASLAELSALADRCLVAALARAEAECGVAAPAVLALGKLGGNELNFSSDVDLLVVYQPPAAADPLEHNRAVAKLVRHLKRKLEEPNAEGFTYRIDLDLRPEGRSGVLANSVDAALAYYESFGAEWERQMLLRLRPVAGPAQVALEFARGVEPFVYRRSIDPQVMRNVRAMKSRIERERLEAGRNLDNDLKEGPGGIRDVEFLVQALQLFHGGREASLRTGNVLEALAALARLDLLPEAVAQALSDAYRWLRRAEHALQLDEERQTAQLPTSGRGQLELARRMGYAAAEGEAARTGFLEDWTSVRNEVRAHFEALVLGEAP